MISSFMYFATIVIPLMLGGPTAELPTTIEVQTTSLAIMDIRVESGIDRGISRTLSELLLTEASKFKNYQVSGERDVAALMNLEERNRLLGCDHDHCVIELAQALGSEQVIFSSVGKVGNYFLVVCKLYDGTSGKIIRRWAQQIKDDEGKLIGAMRRAVDALLGSVAGPLSKPEVLESRGLGVAPWVSGTVAIASAVAGAVLGNMVQEELGVSPAHPSYTNTVESVSEKALYANLSFGIAGASALLTGLLLIF